MTELSEEQLLAQHEYDDISANLRHYVNVQLAQFAAFFAINGGMLLASKQGELTPTGLVEIKVGGIALSILFLAQNSRIIEYWDDRITRAKDLEGILGYEQYQRTPEKRFVTRAIDNAVGIALCYMVLGVFWILALLPTIGEGPWLLLPILLLAAYFLFCFEVFRKELIKR